MIEKYTPPSVKFQLYQITSQLHHQYNLLKQLTNLGRQI